MVDLVGPIKLSRLRLEKTHLSNIPTIAVSISNSKFLITIFIFYLPRLLILTSLEILFFSILKNRNDPLVNQLRKIGGICLKFG